jgi:hypothetical protein
MQKTYRQLIEEAKASDEAKAKEAKAKEEAEKAEKAHAD